MQLRFSDIDDKDDVCKSRSALEIPKVARRELEANMSRVSAWLRGQDASECR